MLTDTHAHFDGTMSPAELGAVFERAAAAGVTRIIAVGGEPGSNAAALQLSRDHAGRCRAVIGYDRHLAAAAPDLDGLRQAIASAPAGHIAGIGETGLDLHYSPETLEEQKRLMGWHLELARSLRLPVVIHTREADELTCDLLANHARLWDGEPERIGVIHCFTGDEALAGRLLSLGFFISFSGIVTFRNADPLRNVARHVPAERLLVETDTPYLAPVPHRGKTNEPAFLPAVAATLAAVRGQSLEDIARITSANAARLFGWPSA